MSEWISFPRWDGVTSRQAHADLPRGTYERELGRDGFAGPATHVYHAHPPTGWIEWEGPLKPRAFDAGQLGVPVSSPWDAVTLLSNPHLGYRLWRAEAGMDHLARNADGDELLFVHEGKGDLFCDFGHLPFRDGDYILLPRGTRWRIETGAPLTVLMIEATDGAYRMPDKGIVGEHAIFDPAMLDVPAMDDAFHAQQSDDERWRLVIKRRDALSTLSARRGGLEGHAIAGAHQLAGAAAADEPPLPPAAVRAHPVRHRPVHGFDVRATADGK